jgi:hypothetical protein
MRTTTSILHSLLASTGVCRAAALAAVCLLGVAACDGGETTSGSTSTETTTKTSTTTSATTGQGGAGAQGGSTGGSTGGAQGGSTGQGGTGAGGNPPEPVPFCGYSCSSPSECTSPDAPQIVDASHYSCATGICEYTGCKTTAECVAAYGADYICASENGVPHKFCQTGCSAPADCVTAGAPVVMNASHWACNAGVCDYTGCKNDSECVAAYGAQYGCGTYPGFDSKFCQMTCDAPADCVSPDAGVYNDASHYECKAGFCWYTGCKSDAECKAELNNPNFVCQ